MGFCHSPVNFCTHSRTCVSSFLHTPAHAHILPHVVMHAYQWENEKSPIAPCFTHTGFDVSSATVLPPLYTELICYHVLSLCWANIRHQVISLLCVCTTDHRSEQIAFYRQWHTKLNTMNEVTFNSVWVKIAFMLLKPPIIQGMKAQLSTQELVRLLLNVWCISLPLPLPLPSPCCCWISSLLSQIASLRAENAGNPSLWTPRSHASERPTP